MRDPIAEFIEYNRPFARHNAELIRAKVSRMAASPFTFFRGTFHLFARDMIEHAVGGPLLQWDGPEVDLVGDIHTENFGTYKADKDVHYDINDFDETTQGRFDFDVCRLAASWVLNLFDRGTALNQDRLATLGEATQIVLSFLKAYAETVRRLLKKGKDRNLDVSEKSPSGCPAVDELIAASAAKSRTDFILKKMTEPSDGGRLIRRTANYFNLPEGEKQQALRLLADYVTRMPAPSQPDYYTPLDVCGRIAGIGSMGRSRFVVLVHGKGNKEGRNVLLEFKQAMPSAYDLYRKRQADAEALKARAERVVAVQRQSQAACGNHLGFALEGGLSYQAREVSPHDDRVDVAGQKTLARVEGVAQVQAQVLARVHARAAARAVGPTNPLAEIEDPSSFATRVLAFALAYADLTTRDWKRFVGNRGDLENVSGWI
jgi:uncharacterized protein (DUF2252 family)